jgi:protease II
VLRLSYQSLTTPASVLDHNMATGVRVTKKVTPVRSTLLPAASGSTLYVTNTLDPVQHPRTSVLEHEMATGARVEMSRQRILLTASVCNESDLSLKWM